MKTILTEIKGVSPLLINRFTENSELPQRMRKAGKKDYGTPRFQAEATAYSDPDLKLWVPSMWVKGAIQAIASDYKLPSSRKSVKSVSGGSILFPEEKLYFNENYFLKDIEVDSRPVVIHRARVMRHRARLELWSIKFNIEIDDSILDVENVHDILSDAGKRSGIGDYRPQKGGPFGRFQITHWSDLQ